MVDFAGWEMPLLYQGIIPEHNHTRHQVSIFDICHMGEFEISGPTAESDLQSLLTQSVPSIQEGVGSYGYLTDENGGVIDDLICFRMAPDRFWLVVNAGTAAADAAWITSHLSKTTIFNDISSATAKIDIQGPRTLDVLEQLFPGNIPSLKYFRFKKINLRGVSCLLSRTGYTGELGYELFLPADKAREFWQLLLSSDLVRPAGLGARDTLRVEMGYPLYGHELSRARTPVGAAGDRFIDLTKKFIGCDAIRSELDDPQRQYLVGLLLEGRMAARAGAEVYLNDQLIGTVTSGLFSPSLNRAVALAYVRQDCSRSGTQLEIAARGRRLPVLTVDLPLYRDGTARKKQEKK